MDLPIFYASPENRKADLIELSKKESRHLARVLRIKKGELVLVVDGLGVAFRGELLVASPTSAKVRILGEIRNFGEPSIRLTLAAGLTSGQKFNSTIEKGTEIGVKRFVPLICEKSPIKIDEPGRAANRLKRLERVALAAIKQCRRSYQPEIRIPCTVKELADETDRTGLNLIFTPSGHRGGLKELFTGTKPNRVTVAVGPEAGFSKSEIETAVAGGFEPVSLGDRILRTETAGPVVTALVMQAIGEFN